MKTSRLVGLALIAAGAMVAAPFVMAQPPADGDRQGKRAEFRKQRKAKMKAKRGEMLRKELGLADAKATQIETTLDSYRKQMKVIRKAQRTLMGKIEALIAADSNDDQAYEYNLRAIKYNKAQLDKLQQTKRDFLSKSLTPKQQAIMLMKRKAFKKHRRGRRGHRRGGAGKAGF